MTAQGKKYLTRVLVGALATVLSTILIGTLDWIGSTTLANLKATIALQGQVARVQMQVSAMTQLPDRVTRVEIKQLDDEAKIAENARNIATRNSHR